MSHPAPHPDDQAPTTEDLKPRPRAPFELFSSANSSPPSPPPEGMPLSADGSKMPEMGDSTVPPPPRTPQRTKSFKDLTSSALFGIYHPDGSETADQTPWGTGAQTPAEGMLNRMNSYDFSKLNLPQSAMYERGKDGRMWRRDPTSQIHKQRTQKKGLKGYWLPFAGKTVVLFGLGMCYGVLISHLYTKQNLAPTTVDIDRSGWQYLTMWGAIGAVLGNLLPWADEFWSTPIQHDYYAPQTDAQRQAQKSDGLEMWMDGARSIGAFVGVAFAIRKLPWQSSLQLSLTLALANPAVWYLIDRSAPGFIVSAGVALSGTALLLGADPSLVPSPSPWEVVQARVGGAANHTLVVPKSEELVLGIFSEELVGVATWVASVLFVSCVCFGNVGRRLTPRSA